MLDRTEAAWAAYIATLAGAGPKGTIATEQHRRALEAALRAADTAAAKRCRCSHCVKAHALGKPTNPNGCVLDYCAMRRLRPDQGER